MRGVMGNPIMPETPKGYTFCNRMIFLVAIGSTLLLLNFLPKLEYYSVLVLIAVGNGLPYILRFIFYNDEFRKYEKEVASHLEFKQIQKMNTVNMLKDGNVNENIENYKKLNKKPW
jgi:hypothetical protein